MIIAFASGKGGTGKTTIATNFALSLADVEDLKEIQFLDCDVEEPNAAIFLKPEITNTYSVDIPIPAVDLGKCTFCGKCADICAYHAIAVINPTGSSKQRYTTEVSKNGSVEPRRNVLVFPELCHGCGGCSFFCPQEAISETPREIGVIETGKAGIIDFLQGRLNIGEPMASPVIRELKKRVKENVTCRKKEGRTGWSVGNGRALTIIDVPPGTSCPVVEALRGSDFAVLVTEPTPFGLYDLELAVATVKKLNVPCGVVLNRDSKGYDGVQAYCKNEGIPILMQIPMDKKIAVAYSEGIPLIEVRAAYRDQFRELYRRIANLA